MFGKHIMVIYGRKSIVKAAELAANIFGVFFWPLLTIFYFSVPNQFPKSAHRILWSPDPKPSEASTQSILL